MGSCLTNKYAEGYPGARYYGGNQIIDEVERLCQTRALQAFGLSEEEWGVNVQPLSGSPANFAVFTALLEPHERLMGLDLSHGGHLTHGYRTLKKKISATSIFWETFSYALNLETGLIDYDALRESANHFYPKLIIAGCTCYTRDIDYSQFRSICDQVGAYLMVDMAHTAGLIAAGELRSPFEYADVVTTTTHKTLRGPRAGLIFYRRKSHLSGEDLKPKIDFSVFPRLQGGPHQHCIAGISTALLDAQSEDFKNYQKNVKKNAVVLADSLRKGGLSLVSDGTENHLVWVDLRPKGIDGARVEAVLERASITLNKNTVPGDLKPFVPSGLRLGTPALTTRGFEEADIQKVAEFLLKGVDIALRKKNGVQKQKLSEFIRSLDQTKDEEISGLKETVESFAAKFPYPGRQHQ
eukprot:CAMPEP_0201475254 /NCGR_PEP_ID=MMETSP0151_2-20130828/699_1 /ASSEMBLY_ACC=CAM_ASM_000257 /TAXON_ID=200890 /ORGANISM="Paramoeba atlantica, Strain 621/1 / CCAP 1560/9" /LENGTH=409 /DNA_ID=CAMNT_0047855293 /DNA_START=214 /DNA_END=1443 /DNA_ORIENTATION=+